MEFKKYPLIKVFRNGDGFIIYDAKSDFAFFISQKQIKYLKRILEETTSPEPDFESFAEKINDFKKCGALLPGPFINIGFRNIEETIKQIEHYSEDIVIRKFNIEVTEDCSFRCKYCANTMAKTGRVHTKQNIDFGTAKKAIDYYFNRYICQLKLLSKNKRKELLKINAPGMTWYGGEPLLNFEVIKKSHEYFLSLPWEEVDADKSSFIFGLTSNLGQLPEQILDYFAQNNFLLHISLDGPEDEHNKNRIFIDGRGTYKTVYENIKKIKSKYPEYYKEKIFFISVTSYNTDKEKCDEFFEKTRQEGNDLYGYKNRITSEYTERGTIIPDAGLKLALIKENKELELKIFEEKFSNITVEEFEKIEYEDEYTHNNFLGLKRFLEIKTDKPYGCYNLHSIGTCPMGFDNLMVDARGNWHMCHKTDNTLPLGNVNDGLDLKIIERAYTEFNRTMDNDDCKNCWAIRFCKICAAIKLDNGKFISATKEDCEYTRETNELLFRKFLVVHDNEELMEYFEEREKMDTEPGIIDIKTFIDD